MPILLAKIAREYQVMAMKEPTFLELRKALKGEDGRKIIANYGLDPLLESTIKQFVQSVYILLLRKTKYVLNVEARKLSKG